jgi:glycosyltransferase involved in cell wall biosynthesis
VLGANIGGIPDFVKHGTNGLLFRANDRTDLARIITDLVRDPAQIDTLRAGITAPKSMAEHAGELLAEYTSLGVRA